MSLRTSKSAKNLFKQIKSSDAGKIVKDGSERLHKRIAASGLCSRRKAEEMILEGRVMVNGQIIMELGMKVYPGDEIRVDQRPLKVTEHHYYVMNKPVGVVTTLSDPQGRLSLKDYLPDLNMGLKPVGRLDMDSEGLLLLTNDGELIQKLTHPSYGVEKEYIVTVQNLVDERGFERLEKGVRIEGGKTAPAKVHSIHRDEHKSRTTFTIVIHEGRNRQIRKMCEVIGHGVHRLKRVRVGPVSLGKLPKGACRRLGKQEVDGLKKLAGLG